MASTLTIVFTPASPTPANGYIVKYRIKGTTGSYTTVSPNPTSSPVTIIDLLDDTNYEGLIQSDCPYIDSTIVNFSTDSCFCPDGYDIVIDGDNQYCQKVDVQDADCTVPAGTNLACHTQLSEYGIYGMVFYQLGKYNIDGTWSLAALADYPDLYNTSNLQIPPPNHINFHTLVTSPFLNAGDTTHGRLNIAGIWKCGDSTYAGILGFSRQITLEDSGIYYIGIGADNHASIKVNGTLILDQDVTATKATNYFNNGPGNHLFRYWHMYPVMLSAGVNNIEVDCENSGGPGVIGVEIYQATKTQLITCTTETALQAYLVYSTKPGLGVTGLVGGSGYTNGVYEDINLTGGAGTGAKAQITVAGNSVTLVKIKDSGTGYVTGNTLSAAGGDIGGGTGFHFTVGITGGDVNDYEGFDIGNCNCDDHPGYTIIDTGEEDEDGNEIYNCQKVLTVDCE